MGAVKVITFDAFGETWSSVAAFAKEYSGGDRGRYERIRSRLYKGLCTGEQAVELERYHGNHRKRKMAEMRAQNEKRGVVVVNHAKGPPISKPFEAYDGHHDTLRMHITLVEKTAYRDTTVYEITHYCCGVTVLMTHAQILRREQGGFILCQRCARSGYKRRLAAKRWEKLAGLTEEDRDMVLFGEKRGDLDEVEKQISSPDSFWFLAEMMPPASVLEASRSSSDLWEDRMYLRWEQT